MHQGVGDTDRQNQNIHNSSPSTDEPRLTLETPGEIKGNVKPAKTAVEKKTPGTVAVEKHRPLMNKLSAAERRRLRRRAAELLYGREALASGR